jgi:hypothetical protein
MVVFDVLITGSVVYTGRDIIVDGYVYIKGGRIVDVGSQPVPEDYTYATLVLGGPHRIILPGLAVVADVIAYPIRFREASIFDRIEFYRSVSPRAQAALAIPGVYELHMRGISTILVEALEPRVVVDIQEMSGGRFGLAVPACIEKPRSPLPLISVSMPGCEAEGAVDVGEIPYLAGVYSYSYALSRIGPALWSLNYTLREKAGLPKGLLEPGAPAEIAVFDARKPPFSYQDFYPEKALLAPLLGGTVETLIVSDEVLVDGGQHLNIVDKQFSQAISTAEALLGGQ